MAEENPTKSPVELNYSQRLSEFLTAEVQNILNKRFKIMEKSID